MSTRPSYRSPHSRETVDVNRLCQILMNHRGEQAAVRARDLVVRLGLGHHDHYPERSIREAIGVLIRAGVPIGSTVKKPYGYFVLETEEELRRCVANYRARAREIEKKALALTDAFRRATAQPAASGSVLGTSTIPMSASARGEWT